MYREIVERSRDGICWVQKGFLKSVNRSMAQMIGYSPEEMVGTSFLKYVHPDDPGLTRKSYDPFGSGGAGEHRYEIDLIHRDGSRVGIELTKSVVRENGAKSDLIFVRDVSERKGFKKDLEDRTCELGDRVRALNCLYMISKIMENGEHSLEEMLPRIVTVIPSAFPCPELTSARLVVGDRVFYSKNFRETNCMAAANIVLDGQRVGTLEVFCSNQGPERDFDPFSKEERRFMAVLAIRIRRIVERMRAMESLKKSEERYRILAENIADGIAILQNNSFVFLNEALCSILGYEREELFEKECLSILHEEHRNHYAQLMDVSMNDLAASKFQVKCIRKDNREIWAEASLSLIEWEGRSAILATIRDITETKEQEIVREEEREQLRIENSNLKASLVGRSRHVYIIGKSPAMQKVYDFVQMASSLDSIVLIQGESGTGKELVARTIHELSQRRDRPFIPVNCGAIPESLFESEFFGHRKGAFTGATEAKHGFFDLAQGGTLFLDEIGELSRKMQVKLLRTIEGNGHMPVGGNKIKIADVRIIAATNRNLGDQLRNGGMREDFFYRIHVVPIHLPPLRERKEDIPLLVAYFLKSRFHGSVRPTIPKKTIEAFQAHPWHGNVRELQNALERYLVVRRLDYALPETEDTESLTNDEKGPENMPLTLAIEHFQKEFITKALSQTQWNRGKAASVLGIDRKTLFRKMKNYRLNTTDFGASLPHS